MKLLLDEQVPARLARAFPENSDVHTVQKMGWASAKNGELLKLVPAIITLMEDNLTAKFYRIEK